MKVQTSVMALAVSAGSVVAQTATITAIPRPPGGGVDVDATAVSADGSTVIGYTLSNGSPTTRDFVWTSATGTIVPAPMAGGTTVRFLALSADGSVIAGWGDSAAGTRAFRWTRSGGYQVLPPPPGATRTIATAISSDGATVLGFVGDIYLNPVPWRWTQAMGTQTLAGSWRPAAMSADGSVIVGSTQETTTGAHMVRVRAGVLEDFPPPLGYWEAEAQGVSGDGRVIVGIFQGGMPVPFTEGYRWTAAGFEELPIVWSAAQAVSMDGFVTVGNSGVLGQTGVAYAWMGNGVRIDLAAYLRSAGASVPSAGLSLATGITPDARTIVGPGGIGGSSWLARMPPGFGCMANCDGSTSEPVLNILDFLCYLQHFSAGDAYANCDGSTAAPVLNVADFTCFLNKFAAGCP